MAVVALGGLVVPYYLHEEQGWAVQLEELRRALHTARGRCNPTVLYIINPGSPTGNGNFSATDRFVCVHIHVFKFRYETCMSGIFTLS